MAHLVGPSCWSILGFPLHEVTESTKCTAPNTLNGNASPSRGYNLPRIMFTIYAPGSSRIKQLKIKWDFPKPFLAFRSILSGALFVFPICLSLSFLSACGPVILNSAKENPPEYRVLASC